MRPRNGVVLVVALVLTAASCSSGSTPTSTTDQGEVDAAQAGDTVRLENEGGALEGHTPRGFAGMGTGLFVGDNLNPGFPDGDGVQLFVSFDLPEGGPVPISAVLSSDALSVSGRPFEDLGVLRAEPVSYDQFGPDLFELDPDGDAVDCERTGDVAVQCDVTAAVAGAVAAGDDRAQFRLRFDQAADNDGQPDLASFFLTDSNTNEPGIFTLEVQL
jgi:hypothetical protein